MHCDATRHTVHLFDQRQSVFRITPGKVETVSSGTDGVLFRRNPNGEPVVPGFAAEGEWSASVRHIFHLHPIECACARGHVQ